MSREVSVVFTRHADDMLAERNIPREWVELTIRAPELVEPDPTRASITRAYRRMA